MKKKLLFLFFFSTTLTIFAKQIYFEELRPQIAKVKRHSEEDFALGDKLLREIQVLAKSRKRALPRTTLIMETVTHRAGCLWRTDKYWRDRQLYANRKFCWHFFAKFAKI